MRIVKEHEERRNEILDTAEQLFSQIGYTNCSVNEILKQVGIAKGTFYYYFQSKEELLDAIIQRTADTMIQKAEQVAKDKKLSPEDKILNIFLCLRVTDAQSEKLIEEFHKPENALLHQKSLCVLIERVTPILVDVIQEGMEKGIFLCEYPEQYVQIFLSASSTLLDDGMFQMEKNKQNILFVALITMMEQMLGVEKGMLLASAMAEYHYGLDMDEE